MRQDELARRLGWGRSTLSALETGARRASVDDLPDLCRALGVPLADLFRGADPDDIQVMRLS